MKKKVVCLLMCALVLFSSPQGNFAMTKPNASTQSVQKTVMATPSNADVKTLMTNFYTDALEFSGKGAQKYLSKSFPAYDKVLKQWHDIASGNGADHLYKVVVTKVALKTVVKKGDTFTYVMNTEGMVANPLVYSWEKGEYLVTLKYENKNLKIANIVAVPNKSVVSYDLRQSTTFKSMISQTIMFGNDYLEAVKSGLQPTVIDLLKRSSPLGLELKNANIVDDALFSPNKVSNVTVTLTIPKEAQNIDFIDIQPTTKNPNEVIKVTCITESGETFTLDVNPGGALIYRLFGDKKVTFIFEGVSQMTISDFKAHMSAPVHAN